MKEDYDIRKQDYFSKLYHDNHKIAEEEMSYLQEQLRNINLNIQLVAVVVTFFFEFVYFFIPQSASNSTMLEFFLKFVFVPTGLSFLIHLFARIVNHRCKNKIFKNYVVLLGTLMQGAVYVVSHQIFVTINAAFIVVIMLSTAYRDKTLTKISTALSLFLIVLSTFVFKYDPDFIATRDYMLDTLIVVFMIFITHIVAMLILKKNELEKDRVLKAIEEKERYFHGMMRDELSGLYSRVAFRPYMDKVLLSGKRYYLVMMDIDHFKKVNDTYGHPFGDLVIGILGKTLKSHYEEKFIAFRYGGEEFLCVVQDEESKVLERMERLKSEFQKNCREELDGAVFSFSAGVALLDSSMTVSQVLNRADEALYQAKHGGRDRIVPASGAPAMPTGCNTEMQKGKE